MFLHQNECMYSSSCILEENRLKAYKFYIDDGKLEQIGFVYIDGMYPKDEKMGGELLWKQQEEGCGQYMIHCEWMFAERRKKP